MPEQLKRNGTCSDAEKIEYFGVALKAVLFSARFLLNASEPDAAAARLSGIARRALASIQPADLYLPAWSIGHDVLAANGDASGAATLLARAIEWIEQTGLPNVPLPIATASCIAIRSIDGC